MTPVAHRIVMTFLLRPGSWQAQYLVMLEDDTCCSPQCNDVSSVTRIVASTVFGDVGG